MSKITTGSFLKGIFIEFKSEPHQIVEFQHVNPGKGSAFVRTKLKGLKTGKVQEFTFKSGEMVEEIPIMVREMQYLYRVDKDYYFMDKANYEQITVSEDVIGNFHKFIKDGEIYQILIHDSIGVGMRYPKKVKMRVIESGEAVKGNTVMGAKKLVTLETGIQVAVPLFIKDGDTISIDPETGEYLERVSQK